MFGADDDLRLVSPGLRGEAAVTRAVTVLEAVHTVLLATVLLTEKAIVMILVLGLKIVNSPRYSQLTKG